MDRSKGQMPNTGTIMTRIIEKVQRVLDHLNPEDDISEEMASEIKKFQ